MWQKRFQTRSIRNDYALHAFFRSLRKSSIDSLKSVKPYLPMISMKARLLKPATSAAWPSDNLPLSYNSPARMTRASNSETAEKYGKRIDMVCMRLAFGYKVNSTIVKRACQVPITLPLNSTAQKSPLSPARRLRRQ